MNTNPSLGAGLAGVLANAVAAGIIASSRGSAIAAPAPLRNVRLGIAFLVMNTTRSFLITTRAKGSVCHKVFAPTGPEGRKIVAPAARPGERINKTDRGPEGRKILSHNLTPLPGLG